MTDRMTHIAAVIAVAAIMVVLTGFSRDGVASTAFEGASVDVLSGTAIAGYTYSYRVDPASGNAPDINDILRLPEDAWSVPVSGTPNFGYTDDTYWFRVGLQAPDSSLSGRYYYVVDYPVLDHIDVYVMSGGAVEAAYISGDTVPYWQRPVESNKFVFPVTLEPGDSKTLYVRLNTQGTLQLPAKLLTEKAYHQEEFAFYLLQGIFVGVIGIMLFYNLSLWYVFKTRDYLFYVLYGLSMLAVQLTMLGLTFQYLWPEAIWWNNAVIPFSIAATVTFLLLFTNSFLSVPDNREVISRIIHGYCAALGVFAAGSFFLPYDVAIKIAIVSVIPGLVLCLGAAIDALRYNASLAKLYLISWLGVLLGSGSLALTKFGLLPTNVLTANGWQIGAGIEITLLSFALSSKIKAVTDKRIAAEKEAKKATALIAKHLQQYKTIYNNSIEGLFKIDLEQQRIIYNESFAALNGLPKGSGESGDPALIAELMERLKLDQSTVQLGDHSLRRDEEQVVHQREDRETWFAIKRQYLENTEGRIVAIEGSLVDISDRKLKEKAEGQLLESLKKADKVKNEFLSTISHELLTPLNGINGHLQLLSLQMPDNEHLRGIECSYSEMLMLVNRILNFSQLHAGSLELEPSDFSLADVVESLAAKYGKICREKGLDFQTDIQQALPERVVGDSRKICQILDELLANAVKFTLKGHITLSLRFAASQPAQADERPGIRLIFSVVDTGVGIRQQDRERIFSLFQQADGSFHRSYGGVGLGLHLSKALSDMMQGDLVLVPGREKGSRFDFALDLEVRDGLQKNALARVPDRKTSGDVRLLVVEDNIVNQKIMRGILKSLGYACQIAENGEVALGLLNEQRFDLVFMDCQMPVKDGFETTRALRAHAGPNRNVPVIAVTANAMSGDRERCLSVGMNDFLHKPVNRQVLEQCIHHWLDGEPDAIQSAS